MRGPNRANPRRRLVDAAITLPLVGAVFVFVPLLWPQPDHAVDPMQTSSAIIYLFAIWALMIVGACILAFALRKTDTSDD